MLTFSTYDTNTDHLFEILGWKNLPSQRKIAKTIMVYKSLNGLAPDYLAEMFIDRSNITNHVERHQWQTCNTATADGLFKEYSGAVLWNWLPSDLRQASSLQKFKADCSNLFR